MKNSKFQNFFVSPFWAWPLGTLGFAPRDLDQRSVLLDIRFVCVYPPPCTFLGVSNTPKCFFGVYGVSPPPPVQSQISRALGHLLKKISTLKFSLLQCIDNFLSIHELFLFHGIIGLISAQVDSQSCENQNKRPKTTIPPFSQSLQHSIWIFQYFDNVIRSYKCTALQDTPGIGHNTKFVWTVSDCFCFCTTSLSILIFVCLNIDYFSFFKGTQSRKIIFQYVKKQ